MRVSRATAARSMKAAGLQRARGCRVRATILEPTLDRQQDLVK
jgi:hypothetical protein